MDSLTPKQIAQTYMLNEIVMHELILEALNEVESLMYTTDRPFTRHDVIHKVSSLALKDELCATFDISANDVLKALRNEYINEIQELIDRNKTVASSS